MPAELKNSRIFFYYPQSLWDEMALRGDYSREEKVIAELLRRQMITWQQASFAIWRIPEIREFIHERNILVEVAGEPPQWFVFNWKTWQVQKLNNIKRRSN